MKFWKTKEDINMADIPKIEPLLLFDKQPRGHTIYLGAFFKTEDAVRHAYKILSPEATILSEPKSLSYTPCVAGLIDKFGIRWDLMVYEE